MNHVAVIGIGGIGRRHLQSLAKLSDKFRLYGIEKNEDTLVLLREEFGDRVTFCGYGDLPNKLDLCIIATSSNVRRKVFEELVSCAEVKNIIFEKVLFQKMNEYYDVQRKLQEMGIKAWVNCTRREQGAYRQLKEQLKSMEQFIFTVTGGEWGLCCNGVHFIDLMEFLTGETDYNIDASALEPEWIESKRRGFYELYGTLTGKNGRCKYFQISCLKGRAIPVIVSISGNNANIIIDETHQIVHVSDEKNGWKWETKPFRFQYTSEITGRMVRDIVENRTCNLPDYDTSMKTHLRFMHCIFDLFGKNSIKENETCPIT